VLAVKRNTLQKYKAGKLQKYDFDHCGILSVKISDFSDEGGLGLGG
jgi:hypothetical protein